jgi:uncharacterized membrane protein SirB2
MHIKGLNKYKDIQAHIVRMKNDFDVTKPSGILIIKASKNIAEHSSWMIEKLFIHLTVYITFIFNEGILKSNKTKR